MNEKDVFVKHNVTFAEYFIHDWIYYLLKDLSNTKETNINIRVPKILQYDKENKILTMQRIHGDNLSNIYGEDIEEVPIKLVKIIRQIISVLNYYLVEYVDITGYNFMLDKNNHLWIIDFGHAKCREKDDKVDSFLMNFVNGKLSWNPEFK